MKVAEDISRGTLECEWVNPFRPEDLCINAVLNFDTFQKIVGWVLINISPSNIF